jgi:small-conductance mechanosensitive channel
MKLRHWITAAVLLLLVGGAIAGYVLTRELPAPADEAVTTPGKKPGKKPARTQRLVDLRPLDTAQRMAALAGTPEEQALAHEAEKTADHEVDLAFFDRIRALEENPLALSPEAKQIADRKAKAEQAVKEDQQNIALLTQRLATAPETKKDSLQDQIDVIKAQLELDQDELDDAAEDLEQAGGDPQSKIKRLQAQHEAGDHNPTAVGSAVNPQERDYQSHTLLNLFRARQALRDKIVQLELAQQEATTKQQRLSQRHATLAARVEQEKPNRTAAKQQAKQFVQDTTSGDREQVKTAASAAVDSLKQYTHDQKNLADLGRRVQDQQDLADIYGRWIGVVEVRQRAALHNFFETLLWILLLLFAIYLAERLIERVFSGMSVENKRIETMESVVKFSVRAVGAIVILFIIFGMPTQTTTIIGLAGAGLTVALKDFIVSFFGWFVLMGRDGIRVGDWVEINGVGGEVIEIGLLKTVLLETGNWTDSSHPTGRRVSFVNSFAIEGHFFNFTTSGQWMWDDLQVLVPSSKDPYAMLEEIQKLVEKETAINAGKAAAEWQQTTTRYRAKTLSAKPGINVVPTGAGIEIHIRYITRAYERHETRRRLYEAIVETLHGKREAVATAVNS